MPQKDIASNMLKTAGNVTLVLDNLEKQGFITRTRQTDDRRIVCVNLTALGTNTFDRIYPQHVDRIITAMSGLDATGIRDLQKLLDELHPSVNIPQCQPKETDSALKQA